MVLGRMLRMGWRARRSMRGRWCHKPSRGIFLDCPHSTGSWSAAASRSDWATASLLWWRASALWWHHVIAWSSWSWSWSTWSRASRSWSLLLRLCMDRCGIGRDHWRNGSQRPPCQILQTENKLPRRNNVSRPNDNIPAHRMAQLIHGPDL